MITVDVKKTIDGLQDENGQIPRLEPEDAFFDEIEEKKNKINTVDNENGEEATVEYMQRLFAACQKIFGDEEDVCTGEELRMFTNKEELEEIRGLIQKTPGVLEKWKNLFIDYELKKQKEEEPPLKVEGPRMDKTFKVNFFTSPLNELSSFVDDIELPSLTHKSKTTIYMREDDNFTVLKTLKDVIKNKRKFTIIVDFMSGPEFYLNDKAESLFIEDITDYDMGEMPKIRCLNPAFEYARYRIQFKSKVII